ncbi:MAG: hypothetical protein ACXABK_00195 [Candidatus Heimdallarchaeaceae archaeon]|jgi:hypothetical protein
MKLLKKGRILKIKPGYNPNCSSGMWAIWIFIIAAPIAGALFFGGMSTIIARILYKKHIDKYGSGKKSQV